MTTCLKSNAMEGHNIFAENLTRLDNVFGWERILNTTSGYVELQLSHPGDKLKSPKFGCNRYSTDVLQFRE